MACGTAQPYGRRVRRALLLVIAVGFLVAPSSALADYDCGDFSTQAAAQSYFDGKGYSGANDPERLDADGDGEACESNPCPCAAPRQSTPPPPKPACSDGTDNDGDGKTDVGADPGCADASDTDETDAASAPEGRSFAARVVGVTDGDTLKVRLAGGTKTSVRLLGIDTPETTKPGVPVECGGRQATKLAKRLALGKPVTLTIDPTQDQRDRYGRLLAYVDIARTKRDVGRSLLRAGWATTYVYAGVPVERHDRYAAAAETARSKRRGVWRACGGDFHSEQ